ncbi:hypothetical protein AB0A99_26130, partial [Streptomyces fradiae]
MGRQDRATLVSICDQAGRTRGTGFVADHLGTVVTSHETIAGLGRVVLRAPGGSGCAVTPDAVTALPADALALIRAEGLGVRPLAIATRPVPEGAYVRVHALGWREARVLAATPASYAEGRTVHPVSGVLALAIGTEGREALQGGDAAGSPVLDAATGTVLAVLAPALHTGHPTAAPALPLAAAAARTPGGPLARLLRRNAATVPSYGPDLNLAGVLRLAGLTHPAPPAVRPVPRHHLDHHLDLFTAGGPGADPRPPAGRPAVCALVGEPGTGRTTLLAETARRHGTGGAPAVWLRGADLRDGDLSLADAVGRVLGRAGRAVAAADGDWSAYPAAHPAALRELARRVARLGADAGPLLVLLDGPEETPPALAARLPDWTADTLRWLRRHGARLALACGPAHWETAGPLYPAGSLYGYDAAPHAAAPSAAAPGAALPVGDLTREEAEQARARYGLPAGALAAPDARHPLALRLLADLRAALPGAVPGRAARDDLFTAHLNLLCLRAARRVAAGCRPAPGEAELRGLAARVAGRVHEAARRCLGPGHGELDRGAFEELFPWGTGWASAVLAEGLLVPAGAGYRFADEEFGEWLQAAHLDLDAALEALVSARREDAPPPDRLPCWGAVRGGVDVGGVARGGAGAGGVARGGVDVDGPARGGAVSAGGAGPRGVAHGAVPVGGAGSEGAPCGGAAPVGGALLGAAAFDGVVFDGTALDGSVPGGALLGGAALAGAVLDGMPVGAAAPPFGRGPSGAAPRGGGSLGALPGGAVAVGGGVRAVDGGGGRAVAGRALTAGCGPVPGGSADGRGPGEGPVTGPAGGWGPVDGPPEAGEPGPARGDGPTAERAPSPWRALEAGRAPAGALPASGASESASGTGSASERYGATAVGACAGAAAGEGREPAWADRNGWAPGGSAPGPYAAPSHSGEPEPYGAWAGPAVPGFGGAESVAPGSAVPGCVGPGCVVPGSAVPEGRMPGHAVSGRTVPGRAVPDFAVPGRGGPDAAVPGHGGPDAAGLGPGMPDPAVPDLHGSGLGGCDAGAPERYTGAAHARPVETTRRLDHLPGDPDSAAELPADTLRYTAPPLSGRLRTGVPETGGQAVPRGHALPPGSASVWPAPHGPALSPAAGAPATYGPASVSAGATDRPGGPVTDRASGGPWPGGLEPVGQPAWPGHTPTPPPGGPRHGPGRAGR